MVRDGIKKTEAEIKYYLKKTEVEFNKLPFVDISFYSKMISEKNIESTKESMKYASFTAWQMLRFKGYKKSWEAYLKTLGLSETKSVKIDKKEKEEALKEALSLHKRINNGKS